MFKKSGALDYLGQIFSIFGETVAMLCVFAFLFGEGAKDLSTIFSLGSAGLSLVTLLRFLLVVAIIATLRFIVMSDGIIKIIPLWLRIIILFASAFAVTIVFVIIFDWFPIDNIAAWIMFILSFGISCAVSSVVSAFKEKAENRQLEEGLKRLKEEKEWKN